MGGFNLALAQQQMKPVGTGGNQIGGGILKSPTSGVPGQGTPNMGFGGSSSGFSGPTMWGTPNPNAPKTGLGQGTPYMGFGNAPTSNPTPAQPVQMSSSSANAPTANYGTNMPTNYITGPGQQGNGFSGPGSMRAFWQ